MVRVYDRICFICYKTNEPRSKTCVYCDNELPYREVSRGKCSKGAREKIWLEITALQLLLDRHNATNTRFCRY